MIRDEIIRAVRERASLTEVVSDVVALRRRSRGAVGLCPFHSEKTPSFTVSEERGFYHCFGCGEHGDVFAFVMKTQSLSFPDAVRRVAERFGVPLPADADEAGRRGAPLLTANATAAEFFRAALAGAGGGRARAYLAARGLDAAVIERFRIGYAPAGGDALARHLRERGVSGDDSLAAGLVMRRERPDGRSALVDRFRDRIMFPITDATGRTIAFGGRLLPERAAAADPPPKYLNSPESPLFRKGQVLYGLAQARDAIRKTERVLVVEGYMDVVALSQAGIAEVVAPLGTALTVEQLRLVRRFSERVIACFDGDAAGRRAAARSFPIFVEAGLWGRGAFLPTGEDPDSFVRARGQAAFEACVRAAEPLVEAFVDEVAGTDRTAVGHRAAAAREVARLLKRVSNPYEHDLLARLAAERLGVREEILRGEGGPDPGPASVPASGAPAGAEEMLVELMAEDGPLARRIAASGIIAEFTHPEWRRTAETLADAGDAERDGVMQRLPREMRDRIVRRLIEDAADRATEREQAVRDCIATIRRRGRRSADRRLQDEVRDAEQRGDAAALETALRRLQELREREHAEKAGT
jgi:DNA primase